MEWTHGGDRSGFEQEYGMAPLDFSANVSPLGMPESAGQAAAQALSDSAAYPDPFCRELRQTLSVHHGVRPEHILCGNGASDLIYRLCAALRPGKALIPVPSFSEYEAALRLSGSQIERFFLHAENDFCLTEEFMDHITPDLDAVFLCNPNNPTGRTVEPKILKGILDRCRETDALLVLDECFADFLDAPEEHSMLPELQGGNLLILRAFTKFYGMAGLRLGYCLCGDESLLEKMVRCGPPWPVSAPAQAAGAAALQDRTYSCRLREVIQTQRRSLAEGLTSLGLQVIPGEANFLLFFSRAADLGDRLKRRGILIRDCRDFPGLGPGWYRTAVRTEPDNQTLLAAIREVMGTWQGES